MASKVVDSKEVAKNKLGVISYSLTIMQPCLHYYFLSYPMHRRGKGGDLTFSIAPVVGHLTFGFV